MIKPKDLCSRCRKYEGVNTDGLCQSCMLEENKEDEKVNKEFVAWRKGGVGE